MDFKEITRNERLKRKLTLYQFSERLNVSWTTVWRWENGHTEPHDNVKEFWIKKMKGLKK